MEKHEFECNVGVNNNSRCSPVPKFHRDIKLKQNFVCTINGRFSATTSPLGQVDGVGVDKKTLKGEEDKEGEKR